MSKINQPPAKFHCQVCDKSFSTGDNLTRHCKTSLKHISRINANAEYVRCEVCSAKFSTKSNLRRHYKNTGHRDVSELEKEKGGPKAKGDKHRRDSGTAGLEATLQEITGANGVDAGLNLLQEAGSALQLPQTTGMLVQE